MFSKIFSSLQSFYKSPLSLLLLFILIIPVNFMSVLISDLFSSFSVYLASADSQFFGLLFIIKTAFWSFLLYLIVFLALMLLYGFITTVILNLLLNKEYSLSRSLLTNIGKVLGLFIILYLFFVVFWVLNALFSFNTIVLMIFNLLVLIVIIAVFPRWFFVPVCIVDKGDKIKESFVDSWKQTSNKYIAILFFVILFSIIYGIVTYFVSNSIFLYYITSNEILLFILSIIFISIIDAIFLFWFYSVLVKSYEK